MKNLSYLCNVVLIIMVAILTATVLHQSEMFKASQSNWQYVYELKREEAATSDAYKSRYDDLLEEYHELELEYVELKKEYEIFEDIIDEVLYDYELTIVKEEE